MKEFAHSLYRRVSQFVLRIVQVPEYARSLNLHIHPFLIHPIIEMFEKVGKRMAEECPL